MTLLDRGNASRTWIAFGTAPTPSSWLQTWLPGECKLTCLFAEFLALFGHRVRKELTAFIHLARGLDVPNVQHVLHFDVPMNVEVLSIVVSVYTCHSTPSTNAHHVSCC